MLRHRLVEVLAVLVALLASAWVLTRPDGSASKTVEPEDPPEPPDDVPIPPVDGAPAMVDPASLRRAAQPPDDPADAPDRAARWALETTLGGMRATMYVATPRGASDPDRSLAITVIDVDPARYAAGADVEIESEGGAVVRGTTDSKGTLLVTSIPASGATVRVSMPDRLVMAVRRVLPGTLTVAMAPAAPLAICVVEADTRTRIPDARVRVVGSAAPSDDPSPFAQGTTDERGLWRGSVPSTWAVRVIVDTTDGRRVEPVVSPGSPAVTVVHVPRGGRIEGRVLDADGKPRAEARVRLWLEREGTHVSVSSITTHVDGSYLFSGIDPDATYSVVAEDGDFAGSEPVRLVRPVGDVVTLPLRLKPPGSLLVSVTDETGVPVPSARVTLDGNQYGPDSSPSESTGVFERVRVGAHRLHVESSLGPPRDEAITVESGPNRVTLRIDGGIRIDGDVLENSGLVAQHARVTIESVGGDGAGTQTRTTTTDGFGRFAFGSLAPGAWRISASAAGATTLGAAEVTAPARGVHLRLVRLGRARLQLLREAGGPVEGDVEIRRVRPDGEVVHGSGTLERGLVTIEGFDGAPETLEVSVEGCAPLAKEVRVPAGGVTDLGAWVLKSGHKIAGKVVRAGGLPIQGAAVLVGHHGRVVTDKNGDFDFPGVPPGPLELVVVAEDYLHKTLEVDGSAATALRIELSAGVHLAGVVVDVDGKAVGGLRLAFVPTDGSTSGDPVEALRTDEDGTFDVRVPPGRYRVEARPDGDAKPALLSDLTLAEGEERATRLTYRPR